MKNVLVIANIGAIIGGLFFGSFSQSFGRRKTIILVTLLALPVIYFWAYAATPVTLALGAFLMQVCVQGAWGVVPAHLNELAPAAARGTFAGTGLSAGQSDRGGQSAAAIPHRRHGGRQLQIAMAMVATLRGAADRHADLAGAGSA